MTATLPARAAAHVWSAQEKSVLVRAALHTDSCGVGSPWTLEVHEQRVEIYERFRAASWLHDGAGRDRVLACGSALAGVAVAMRVLGWLPETVLLGDAARPDLAACVTARARLRPGNTDARRFQALFDQRRHRHTVDPATLPGDVLDEIVHAGAARGVSLVPLSSFTPASRKQTLDPGLLVVTAADGRRDQILAGAAMQQATLAARTRELTTAPQIGPFQFREFRQRVLRSCGLSGSPQLLLRLGT